MHSEVYIGPGKTIFFGTSQLLKKAIFEGGTWTNKCLVWTRLEFLNLHVVGVRTWSDRGSNQAILLTAILLLFGQCPTMSPTK